MEFKYIHVGSALDQGGDLGGDQGPGGCIVIFEKYNDVFDHLAISSR